MPCQKIGMETPIKAKNIATLSIQVYCFTADKIPNGTPIDTETSTPNKASRNVLGNLVIISLATGRLVT